MNTPLKRCARCKQEKPATNEFFSTHRREVDHLYYICKECNNAPKRKPPKYIVPEGYKRCPQCGENKPATTEYFYPREKSKDGLYSWCKPCSIKRNKERKPRFGPDMTHLTCIKCGKDYPATPEYFHKHRDGVNGIRPICKECGRKASIAWRNNHLDQARANSRQWHETNKEQSNVYSREYYHSRREHYRERWTQYHQTHREEIIRHKKGYYAAHRDQLIAKMRERRQTRSYPSDSKMYHRKHYRTHRAYYIAKAHQRKAVINSIPGTYTAQEAQEQYDRQRGRCYYCRHKVKWGNHHLDHTLPISRQHARNSIDHIVVTCPSCNLKKSNKYPHEFPEGGRLL